ncbi:MAG: hypothetical protein KAS32_10830 [Candidatus Peribacteraceae bacterium]|nr:hypothetical protein [Candidatus Peribacteraceae bacterium]
MIFNIEIEIPDDKAVLAKEYFLLAQKMPTVPVLENDEPTGEVEDKHTFVEWLSIRLKDYALREMAMGKRIKDARTSDLNDYIK